MNFSVEMLAALVGGIVDWVGVEVAAGHADNPLDVRAKEIEALVDLGFSRIEVEVGHSSLRVSCGRPT